MPRSGVLAPPQRTPAARGRRQCAPPRRRGPRACWHAAQKTNLAILRLYARRRGHAHEAAADGAQAVALFREAAATANPISLVLVRRPVCVPVRAPRWRVPPQMDLQMPVMDGVEAVRLIRAHEATHALPPSLIYMGAACASLVLTRALTWVRVVVSGQSFDTDKRRAMDAGADGYFVKPLSLRTLDNLIALHFTAPLL
jgi:CheY-like chemotaxis protein